METVLRKNNLSNALLIGRGRSVSSIAACLAGSGTDVVLRSDDPQKDKKTAIRHLINLQQYTEIIPTGKILTEQELTNEVSPSMAIITGYSDPGIIQSMIHYLEQFDSPELIIAVSTDHIGLNVLQNSTNRPENIVVVNWAEPAHTTFFLEIVHNETTDPRIVSWLEETGKEQWGKDPYIVKSEIGVRGRLKTAMVREAMYLVEEGYANVEDIDRACRNDAGTYLPFAGNFQYMDLMGTYAYGVVMEKLNKELSNATQTPPFFDQVLKNEMDGIQDRKGFYEYSQEEAEEWESRMTSFSFEIRDLIKKYPGSS